MLNRNSGKNNLRLFVIRDEDSYKNGQAQAATMPIASAPAPADSISHQPSSPSVFLAGGDNSLIGYSVLYTGGAVASKDHNQDTDMDTQVQAQGCDFVTSNLSAYLDGELDSTQTRLVGAHLGKCPRCSEILDSLSIMDETIEREWRESAPLPSSFQFEQAIDNIMESLPSVPVEAVAFAAHRIHARTRWMRFATGIAGLVALLTSLWSSYWLGYTNGRRSLASPSAVSANPFRSNPSPTVLPASFSAAFRVKPFQHLTPASFLLPAHSAPLHPPHLLSPLLPSAFSRSSLLTRAVVCP